MESRDCLSNKRHIEVKARCEKQSDSLPEDKPKASRRDKATMRLNVGGCR